LGGWNSRSDGASFDQERFARAMSTSHDGFWDWTVAGDTIYTSPRLLEIYGFAPGTHFAGRDDLIARIPFQSEDRQVVTRVFADHFAGATARCEVEARFIRDGETRWVQLGGVAERDPCGAVVRWTGTVRDITERKRAEDVLRETQERYARVVAASEEAFWDWNSVADALYLSPRFLELFGLPAGTTFARRADMFKALPISEADNQALQAAAIEHFSGKTARMEIEIPASVCGQEKWINFIGRATHDADGKLVRWNGTIRDVTARKRAELAQRDSEERYELAMAASESGYWDWYIPTNEYFLSSRALEMGGYDPNAGISRDEFRARINMHPEDFLRWESAREALFAGTGERLAMEVRYIVHGEIRWHSLQGICKRDGTGKVVRWSGSTTDVTERKRAEEELKSMEHELRQAQRLEAMGTLAGGIAHDFTNILGAVLGYGEMALRDAPRGSRLARDLDNIMIAGERGRALVDRVLAFSRSAVGERVPVHVERVVREVLDQVLAKAPSNVTVHAKLHADRAAVRGDATQVHQVVANLASNAIQAMPDGGALRIGLVVERAGAPKVATIGRCEPGEYVVLTVADSGTGIAPEVIDRIFDPFFTTKEVGTGTGLGLSLVHGIVSALGGAIDVVSTRGAGSTFTIYLPRSGDVAETVVGKESDLPHGAGQRVLIVDDEEPLVQLAARTLEELGYRPFGLTSSRAARAAIRADPRSFDVLITDERMPGMSGSELIREVRGVRESLPVVLMSGYPGATKGDADVVIRKPLSRRDFATSLARVLKPGPGRLRAPSRSRKRQRGTSP
jgi:PAS domain S-box-containing protein